MKKFAAWVGVVLTLWSTCAQALTITTPGAVVTGQSVGDLTISANGVTVRNCTGGTLTINPTDGVTVEGCTFTGTRLTVGAQGTTGLVTRPKLTGNHFTGIGRGVLSGGHAVTWWNVDGAICTDNDYDVTVEAAVTGDAAEGPWWCFDLRNSVIVQDTIKIHLKASCYGIWRLRSDKLLNQGCFNNSWDRFAIVCDGVGGNLFPTSSANCGNGGDYTAQCIGSWNSTIKNSLFDAAACSASSLVFQGGSTGWTVTGTTVRMKNDALHAFDIHGTKWTDNVLTGAVRFTDEYQRPLWKAGDMVWCNNTLNGSMTTAARLAAVPGAFVTTCQTTPPPPPPTPVDTFRVVVKVPSLPATVTVVKQ